MSCPSPEKIFEAVRSADGSVDAHLRDCADCRALFAGHKEVADALKSELDPVSDHLRRSVLALVPKPATRRRAAPTRSSPFAWIAAAAAAIVVAVLLLSSVKSEPPLPVVKIVPPKKVEPVREEPKPVFVEPRKEEPKPAPKEEPTPLVPRSFPKKEEAPVPVPIPEAPKEEPRPVVPPPPKVEPKKSEVEVAKYKPVVVTAVFGPLTRGGAKLTAGTALGRTDLVAAGARQPARFTVGAEYAVSLDRAASIQLEQQESGDTRLTLSGTAFFEVEKRSTPFVIRTPHGEAVVVGTSFQVVAEEKRMTLFVLEGSVRLRNDKGEALVKASQRSSVRAGEKPSTPVRVDLEAETAWRTRPDLTGNPAREPFLESSAGRNRKLAGVVVGSPYHESEIDSGRLAKAVAELADVGLALGHFHRSREKRIWINIDRGTEGEFSADGTLGPAVATDRAKKVTAEYLSHLKAAAGTPERPAPLIVNFRDHSEVQDGAELEICEVAWSGFNPKTIEALKVFYAQLLEKHKPAYRVELRFDRLDDGYDYKGKKRRFLFTERDAKSDGYMAPRHSQRSIAFFFNPSFGSRAEDIDVYARIFAELIEFLHARPR